jgi:hypothetical protein
MMAIDTYRKGMPMIDTANLEELNPKVTKSGRTRSQVGRSSKQKGKAGERFFADILSSTSGMEFIRVPGSGAFVGQSNRDRLIKLSRTQQMISLGDIICPEELTHSFIFESKNYADIDFHNLLTYDGCKAINGWLGEMLYDCESYLMHVKNQKPLIGILCVKITRKGAWAIINADNLHNNGLSVPYPFLSFNHEVPERLRFYGWRTVFYMCDFKTFCNINKSKLFEITTQSTTTSSN